MLSKVPNQLKSNQSDDEINEQISTIENDKSVRD